MADTKQIPITEGLLSGTSWASMQKIIASGISTVGDLARQTPTTLNAQSGVGADTCEKYIALALNMVNEGYITGEQLWERIKTRRKLSTGSRAVDDILEGGIEEQTTTEVSGENACHSDDTNVLTPEGIKSWKELRIGDCVYGERENEVVKNRIEKIYEYNYTGELFRFENIKMDLLITPNHDVYYKKKQNEVLTKIRADELYEKKSGYLSSTLTSTGIKENFINIQKYIKEHKLDNPEKSHPKPPLGLLPTDELLKLMGYYIADGSPLKSRYSVYPTIRHGRKIDKLETLVKSLNLDYSIYEGTKIVIFHDDLGQYLLRCGEGSSNKHIPPEVLEFSPEKLQHLYDGLMECDANKNGTTYYTTSKLLSSQMAYLCLILGKHPSITNRGKKDGKLKDGRKIVARHDCYNINIFPNYKGYFDNRNKFRKEFYNGKVWCYTTETGNLFTERNGKITLSGNSGKTQLMHMLAINAQLSLEQGGLNGKVVWIDSENTFRPDRIAEICTARGYDTTTILQGIIYEEAYHTQHQHAIIAKLPKLCQEQHIKLVIVDSMMAHLRSEYIGREMLARRQNMLGDMLQRLGKISMSHSLTVIYTNQVMDKPIAYGNPETAIGGHVMGHASTLRLNIKRGRQGARIVQLKKSPYMPEREAVFLITEAGIEDTEVNKKQYKEEEDGETN